MMLFTLFDACNANLKAFIPLVSDYSACCKLPLFRQRLTINESNARVQWQTMSMIAQGRMASDVGDRLSRTKIQNRYDLKMSIYQVEKGESGGLPAIHLKR